MNSNLGKTIFIFLFVCLLGLRKTQNAMQELL